MDSEDFRSILSRSGVGIWSLIETAIKVAVSDYGEELKTRRDKIVECLYIPAEHVCRNCNDVVQDHNYYSHNNNNNNNSIDNNNNNNDRKKKINDYDKSNSKSPLTPESNSRNFSGGEEDEDLDPFGGLFGDDEDEDDEQRKITGIKEQLEDPDQSEDGVVELLQNLADMDITFQALKETDIGRPVNRLRKHSSNEVRRLVKQLVRKWKETVDEWVKVNQPQAAENLIADGDSPQHNIPKNQQNGHHQIPDFGYSPNPHNGSSSTERTFVKHETKPKPTQPASRREAPSRPPQSVPKSSSAPTNRLLREPPVDDERLNSARKRLLENYQEAEKAKKQRKIQVMDIHDLPKPKNTFFAKNKGGFNGRQHR